MIRNFLGVVIVSIFTFFLLNKMINPEGYDDGLLLVGMLVISLQISFLISLILVKKNNA